MPYRISLPIIPAALLAVLLTLLAVEPAHAQSAKTRNVVLIVSDGFRWQEVFNGADETLLNEANGGIWDKEADLRREFWRADAGERRRALLPFLWNTVAVRGQIFGNQALGSIARVTNGLAFSYPGYNEMLTGHPDARIDSNEYGPNPNVSVLEWLNTLPELHGKVSVHASWATFKDILNVSRSHLPLQAGWDLPYRGTLTPRQELLNRLYQSITRLDDEDVYDAFMQVSLLESFDKQQPRVLFVGYGETDNWAHAGRYDLVLHSAHQFDHFVSELWERCRHCRPTATAPPSSSPPITAGAEIRWSGRNTASSSRARRTSGSRYWGPTHHRSVSAATLQRCTRHRLPQP